MSKVKDIFLSRPSWIESEFEKGLDTFLTLLKSYDLNPRTIGVSDYPTESPLDEVITIMNQCAGAIILGYPQIKIEKGLLKGDVIEPSKSFFIATEWNHIEASLAYVKELPLLVIHHKGVRRGIFDRGAISKFLYEVDLSDNAWCSDKSIIGALTAWRERVNTFSPSDDRTVVRGDDLQFENRSGTLISQETHLRYCHKCYNSSPPKRVELQESQAYWYCSVCNQYYSNPNWDPPESSPYDPLNY